MIATVIAVALVAYLIGRRRAKSAWQRGYEARMDWEQAELKSQQAVLRQVEVDRLEAMLKGDDES